MMKNHPLLLVITLLLLFIVLTASFTTVNAKVLSCKNLSGITIFTDNQSNCALTSDNNENNITEIKVITPCGKKVTNKHKVDYCSPRRKYYKAGKSWTIYLEQALVDSDKSYADKALNKLDKASMK